jgi:hypothetical protein
MKVVYLGALLLLTTLGRIPHAEAQVAQNNYNGLVAIHGDCTFFNHPNNANKNSDVITAVGSALISSAVSAVGNALKAAASSKQATASARTQLVLSTNEAQSLRCVHIARGEFGTATTTPQLPEWATGTFYGAIVGTFRTSGIEIIREPNFFAEIAILTHSKTGTARAVPVIVDFNEPQFRRWLRPSTKRSTTLSFTLKTPDGQKRDPGTVSFDLNLGTFEAGNTRAFASPTDLCSTRSAPHFVADGCEERAANYFDDRVFLVQSRSFVPAISENAIAWDLEVALTEVQGASAAVKFASDLYEKNSGDIEKELRVALLESEREKAERAEATELSAQTANYARALREAVAALDACIKDPSIASGMSAFSKVTAAQLATPEDVPLQFGTVAALLVLTENNKIKSECEAIKGRLAP